MLLANNPSSHNLVEHTTNLLEHLVHVGQDCSVQVPVLINGEAVLEPALCHLENGVFDGIKLALNGRVVFRKIRKSAKHLQRFLLTTL
jgi:hypothetical protein